MEKMRFVCLGRGLTLLLDVKHAKEMLWNRGVVMLMHAWHSDELGDRCTRYACMQYKGLER
jgi:hypothetical protein